jgi:glycine dehydrogenase subunit 2
MKYNPKIDEWAARLPGFTALHPLVPDELSQGTLQLLWELEGALAEIGGMKAVTLQPAAGAQGELTGILMVRAYHHSRGDLERCEVLVPDSAHGTNPATASMAGFTTVSIPSAPDGGVDVEAFRAALGPRTAAVMITNPSTLGLFESRLCELLDAVHEAGALAYMDGANLNAIMGRFKPGEAGFDVMHINVHKTFSTPHGGGGPGAGPVGVGEKLLPFLPSPRVLRGADGRFRLEAPGERPTSIGRMRAFAGNTGVLVRAYAYIRANGGSGLREVSEDAVLAANYLKARVADLLDVPYSRPCMHEFVASSATLKTQTGIRTLDVAKRLIDYGFHPPTVYFPLTVEEALLIEPTETESIETLDLFVDALRSIVAEAHANPDLLHSAPHGSPVRRLDETAAARQPNLRWRAMTGSQTPCPD